eukprot:3555345-Lingulodinium_polyedra.AAC.1
MYCTCLGHQWPRNGWRRNGSGRAKAQQHASQSNATKPGAKRRRDKIDCGTNATAVSPCLRLSAPVCND